MVHKDVGSYMKKGCYGEVVVVKLARPTILGDEGKFIVKVIFRDEYCA